MGVSIFIILYEPVGSIVVISFLSIFGYVFYKKVQIRAKEWGKGRQFHSGLRIKHLREGFTSIKYIKILNRISEVLKVFTENNTKLNSFEVKTKLHRLSAASLVRVVSYSRFYFANYYNVIFK